MSIVLSAKRLQRGLKHALGLPGGNVSRPDVAIISRNMAGRIGVLAALGLSIFAGRIFAQASSPVTQTVQTANARDLTQVSLEDLMDIKVTSVSKKEQKMSQAATAIYVITQEDIRRSGATNIPDLLRMVPGIDVEQINANTWAISARGFDQQFSDKLLVLIDGRAVYTPLLGGVNWDTQDVPLEDIDRIEVIRGPGATVWGANAVNGVINIVTKKAQETQGGLVSGGGGSDGQAYGVARYGGMLEGTSYRVFMKYLDHGAFPELGGESGVDAWHLLHGGFRADSSISSKDSLTIQGDMYGGREGATIVHIFTIDPPVTNNLNKRLNMSGGNILSRWNHAFSSRSDFSLQFYFDNYTRTGPDSAETRHTIDFDFVHHFAWGSRQDWNWGGGYRKSWDHELGTIDEAFNPPDPLLHLFNFFAQDTVTIVPNRLFLTIGSKFENSYFSGWETEPSVRLAWTPANWETFWAAGSRAARTPDQRDTGLDAALAVFPDPGGSATPVEAVIFGNPMSESEHLLAYEAGYRTQPIGRLSVDLSLFYNRYDHLQTVEPGREVFQPTPAPARFLMPLTFANLMYGATEGGEVAASVKLTNRWTLSPNYAFLEKHLHTKPTSQDTTTAPGTEHGDPQHQAQLRSHVELVHGLSWDANAYFVSALPSDSVPSYTRIDTLLTWKFAERGEFSVVGQNLLRDHHLESNDALTLVNPGLIKRSAYAKLTWRFP
jgi:iron complex outermembrane receptor protein